MTYEESLDYIYSMRKVQKSPTHERIRALLSYLGNPEKELRFVHVVGTNGKGSVTGALSQIFLSAGYRTGLFTSPFVIEFGERIQVDGKYISRERICELTEKIKEYIDRAEETMTPTVFEFITAMAFYHFAKEKCDIVFLEAGIGGEHDSTNVISSPLACVFTSISLDHTDMLGDTVEKIASEKCGIIKKGTAVISYPFESADLGFKPQNSQAAKVIEEKAKAENCPLFVPETDKVRIVERNIDGSVFTYKGMTLKTSLCADHQIANMLTCAETALTLTDRGEKITKADIENGIKNFFIPCRMEKISREPLIILDGGHNEGCMRALRDMTEKYLTGRKITLLMASMKDKEYEKGISLLAPLCENTVFTSADAQRGEKPEILKAYAENYCKKVYAVEDREKAFRKALSLTEKNGVLIVCGSFYLVSDIRKIFLCD